LSDVIQIESSKIYEPLWAEDVRYYFISGGRGSGKSWEVARRLISHQISNPNSSGVCLREVQKSIKYSSKKLIEDMISLMGVQDFFHILSTEIRMTNGTGVIIFSGLQDHTADSIKSLESFDWAWVEEAQSITHYSLSLLTPTIRKDGSKLYFTWNPSDKYDPIETLSETRKDKVHIKSTYLDNKFCTTSIIEEAEELRLSNHEEYLHVYMGHFKIISDAQIYKGKFSVEHFDIDKDAEKYYGLDYGFSVHPTAGIACYEKDNVLYIYGESGGAGIEIEDTNLVIDDIIETKIDLVYADNARPEITSHLVNKGYNVVSCKKWGGCVEDGISTIRGYSNIIIHPSCQRVAEEFSKYSYKLDKANNVTSTIIKNHDHWMDALRYAIQDKILRKNNEELILMRNF